MKLRYINAGDEDQSDDFGDDGYLLDEGTGTEYKETANTYGNANVTIRAGGSIELWVKYTMPEGERPKYLTAVLKNGVLLEHLEVP